MGTVKIEADAIPAKVNSRLLREEIAHALAVQPNDVALEIVLGELRIVRSSPLGTEEQTFPPYISVTAPAGADLGIVPAVVAAHAPAKTDAEEVAFEGARALKDQLRLLATDPEMVALIKGAAAS